MTEGEQMPLGVTPIGRLLNEVGGTDTDIARRASQWGDDQKEVQRQTVTHYRTRAIKRLPPPEMIRAIAGATGADLDAVTTAFIRSQEEYIRGVLGLGPTYQPPTGSLAHAYASRIDTLPDGADRAFVLRAIRVLIESVDGREAEMTDEKSGTASAQAARLAQRILDEIRDGATEADAQAALDELRRRKKKKQDDVS